MYELLCSGICEMFQRYVRDGVSTTSDGLLARAAVPDTDGVTLDGNLTAEGAGVAGAERIYQFPVFCELCGRRAYCWVISIFFTCLRREAP